MGFLKCHLVVCNSGSNSDGSRFIFFRAPVFKNACEHLTFSTKFEEGNNKTKTSCVPEGQCCQTVPDHPGTSSCHCCHWKYWESVWRKFPDWSSHISEDLKWSRMFHFHSGPNGSAEFAENGQSFPESYEHCSGENKPTNCTTTCMLLSSLAGMALLRVTSRAKKIPGLPLSSRLLHSRTYAW